MNNTENIIFSFKCAVCSFFANYVVGIFHPLELLKTRLQSHDGSSDNQVPRYSGLLKGLKQIHQNQGIDGLYKGLHLTMFTQAISSAIFFWIYQLKKKQYQNSSFSILQATTFSSIQASLICTLITQPVWVIKTRVLLNIRPSVGEFQNILLQTKQIWRQNSIKGFYSGLSMNMILSMTGALQMLSYESAKIVYTTMLTSYMGEMSFICGGVSKLVTTFITYPFTTIRTRLQQDPFYNRSEAKYKNAQDIIKKISKQEGMQGFYKGLGVNLLRGIPQRGIYFYFYELFKSWMGLNAEKLTS